MALADDIMSRYRSSGGGSDPESPAEDQGEGGEPSKAAIANAKAAFAAIKKNDAAAFCEAVKAIASEY